jgi:outer membrane lipoprotein-sorting protein
MHRILLSCALLAVLSPAVYGAEKPAENKPKPPAAPAAEKAKEPAAKEPKAAATPFKDEPAAHELYKQMIKALRRADSLSYVSHYTMEAKGVNCGDATYRAWLKKPNYFRIEAESNLMKKTFFRSKESGGGTGVLIGDGRVMWIYWPQGRYKREWEEAKDFEKTRLTTYIQKPAPPGGHSIGHEVCWLGAGMSMPVIDPSTFFGYTDSLQPYLDGVKALGSEKVGNEDCDKIEVSIMKHQRSWYLWVSKRDHLPRKLTQIVRVSYDITMNEEWSSITVNGDVLNKMFVWEPPKDWMRWKEPPLEIGLLKPGTVAPDFDLASADGGRIKLSDFRGKVVWFYVWRAG